MKPIKIITHPATLIICFLCVVISGQHLGGFYLLYIMLALPHGSIHSVLAVVGIMLLLFSIYKYKREFNYLIEPFLNIAGVILLLLSLFLFFYNDKEHYNYSTFYQTVPVVILCVFILLSLIFMVNSLLKLFQPRNYIGNAL